MLGCVTCSPFFVQCHMFSVPWTSHLRLALCNMIGQVVLELLDGTATPGWYEVQVDGTKLSSGFYFYRLQMNDFVQTRRMALTK